MNPPANTTILALDLATRTGWARLASGIIDHGTESFARKTGRKRTPDDHEGKSLLLFLRWLRDRLTEDRPSAIVYERPGHFPSAAAAFMACGLRGILYACAASYQIPIYAYSPTELKKWATGKGTADKSAMLVAAHKRSGGESFTDDNAVDAYLLLLLHLARK
jgi:Holliday junction resolvasome RuvABC endonuclease subunit